MSFTSSSSSLPDPSHPPPQVSVPVVLQRRPDAVWELGLQHGGSPASCPPPGQHHPARQRASSAVDRRDLRLFLRLLLLLLHSTRGFHPKTHPPEHWTNLYSALQTQLLLDCRRQPEGTERKPRAQTTAAWRGHWVSLSFFCVLLYDSLWISLSSLLISDRRWVCCSASRLAWIDSFLWRTELQNRKPNLVFCYYF